MYRILFVIPDLDYGGAAKQLGLLAEGLPRDQFEPRVCALGKDGPLAPHLRSLGVTVEVLGWARLFDPQPLWRVRQQVQAFSPDVIHAWQAAALRAVGLAMLLPRRSRKARQPHTVVSAAFGPLQREAGWAWLDHWLLRRADRAIVSGPAEEEECRRLALPLEKLERIPAGVAVPSRTSDTWRRGRPTSDDTRSRLLPMVPAWARLLMCVGPIEPHKGLRDAIWAFDILKYLYDDLHLVLVGEGGDRPRLQEFARAIGVSSRVHFLGPQADVPALLAGAAIVLVPSLTTGGINVALEGMAAGRPVVASRLPDLAEVVLDGRTGFLFSPGDKVALGRQVHVLLEDSGLCARLGEAGRDRAMTHFAAMDVVRRYVDAYAALSARAPVLVS